MVAIHFFCARGFWGGGGDCSLVGGMWAGTRPAPTGTFEGEGEDGKGGGRGQAQGLPLRVRLKGEGEDGEGGRTRAGTRPAPTVLCLGAKGGRKAGPDL